MKKRKIPLETAIRSLLGLGLGTEDISLILNCNVERVRFEVRRLRAIGELEQVLRVKAPPVKRGLDFPLDGR